MPKRSPWERYHQQQRAADAKILDIMLSTKHMCLCGHPQGFHWADDSGENVGECAPADCACKAFDEDVLAEARLRAEADLAKLSEASGQCGIRHILELGPQMGLLPQVVWAKQDTCTFPQRRPDLRKRQRHNHSPNLIRVAARPADRPGRRRLLVWDKGGARGGRRCRCLGSLRHWPNLNVAIKRRLTPRRTPNIPSIPLGPT
jgi:hypothetical protein